MRDPSRVAFDLNPIHDLVIKVNIIILARFCHLYLEGSVVNGWEDL